MSIGRTVDAVAAIVCLGGTAVVVFIAVNQAADRFSVVQSAARQCADAGGIPVAFAGERVPSQVVCFDKSALLFGNGEAQE